MANPTPKGGKRLKFRVFKARPPHIWAIQRINEACWLATYPNEELGITKEDLSAWLKKRHGRRKTMAARERIEKPERGEFRFVAKAGPSIVGFVRATRAKLGGEINSLYVHPNYQRHGIGTALFMRAKKELNPGLPIFVLVASYNEDAINFYTKLGFRRSGLTHPGHITLLNGISIPEIEMVRSPDSAS